MVIEELFPIKLIFAPLFNLKSPQITTDPSICNVALLLIISSVGFAVGIFPELKFHSY